MFKKILVPIDVDYTETAAAVANKAIALAKMSGAEVRLVSVMPGFGMPIVASYVTDDMRKMVTEKVKEALKTFIAENISEPVTYTVRTGKNWEEIIREAERWGADLIVVYHNRRHDLNEAFSGSCSRRVAEHAECSVLRLRKIQV